MCIKTRSIIIGIIFFNLFYYCSYSQSLIDKPQFSHESGFYTDSLILSISYSINGSFIKYTKDGTNPYTSSTAKSQPSPITITINPMDVSDRDRAPGVVIKACAITNTGEQLTKVATHTYLFLDNIEALSQDSVKPSALWPDPRPGKQMYLQGMDYGMDPVVLHDPRYEAKIKNSLLSIPTISFVTDLKNLFDPDSGIYVNSLKNGREWERPISVELINPDRSPGFQIDAGLRIRGGWGRMGGNLKHSFRLFFRKEYGEAKLKFPLFGNEGVTEFNDVDLRTTHNGSWAMYGAGPNYYTEICDVFTRDIQRDMNQPYTRSRNYHLYINGTYWGIYQTQERSEASYAESYLGGSAADYDVVKVNSLDTLNPLNFFIEATDGNLDGYKKLWEIASKGFYTDEPYYKIQGLNLDGSRNLEYPVLLDIDNLIDFILCTYYVGDGDGPDAGGLPKNFYALNNRNANRGFIFFKYDTEMGLLSVDVNVTLPTPNSIKFSGFNPKWLHDRLCRHPEYKNCFIDHVYKHFYNNGALTSQACLSRFTFREQQIEDAVIAESARWGDAKVTVPRTKDDDWLPLVNFMKDQVISSRTSIVLQQLQKQNLYPPFDPPVFNVQSGLVSKGTLVDINASGGSIYYSLDGNDVRPQADLQKGFQTLLVPRNAEKRIIVPKSELSIKWKYDSTFNDSTWLVCNSSPGGFGYDRGSIFRDLLSYNIENQMYNVGSSCLVRILFDVTADQLKTFDYLLLRMQYSDGFVVYLNKPYPILSKNFSGNTPKWNSVADSSHADKSIEFFDITNYKSNLVAGKNVLAIHGLNVSKADSNFFLSVELVAGNSLLTANTVSPSAILYSGQIPITNSAKIKARVFKDDQWSALNEVFLWVPEGNENLKITEIMYHPLGEGGVDDKEFEFIEFKNVGKSAINLSGFQFACGINYTFPTGTMIDSSAHLVIASNDTAFESRYHFAPFGRYSGQLGNAGDTLVLLSNTGDTVMHFSYGDEYPWPSSSDGLGYSLVRIPDKLYQDPNNPESWHASLMINGNPGKDDRITAVETEKVNQPRQFKLWQNYPNPFNPSTTIAFNLPSKSFVTLKIYDVIGREIATVVSEVLGEGSYTRQWNAQGKSSGVYFYRIRAGSYVETKKMILLR